MGGHARQHGGGTRPKPAGRGVAPYYRRLHGALKHHHEHPELSIHNNHLLVSINERLGQVVGLLGGEPAGWDIEPTSAQRILSDLWHVERLAATETGNENAAMAEYLKRLMGAR